MRTGEKLITDFVDDINRVTLGFGKIHYGLVEDVFEENGRYTTDVLIDGENVTINVYLSDGGEINKYESNPSLDKHIILPYVISMSYIIRERKINTYYDNEDITVTVHLHGEFNYLNDDKFHEFDKSLVNLIKECDQENKDTLESIMLAYGKNDFNEEVVAAITKYFNGVIQENFKPLLTIHDLGFYLPRVEAAKTVLKMMNVVSSLCKNASHLNTAAKKIINTFSSFVWNSFVLLDGSEEKELMNEILNFGKEYDNPDFVLTYFTLIDVIALMEYISYDKEVMRARVLEMKDFYLSLDDNNDEGFVEIIDLYVTRIMSSLDGKPYFKRMN